MKGEDHGIAHGAKPVTYTFTDGQTVERTL